MRTKKTLLGNGNREVFVEDVHLTLGVSLKDVRSTDQVEPLFRALAATNVAAGGLKRERVTRHACVAPDQHDIDGAEFHLHPRFWAEILAGASHRTEPAGFGPPHGNLEDLASRGIVRA